MKRAITGTAADTTGVAVTDVVVVVVVVVVVAIVVAACTSVGAAEQPVKEMSVDGCGGGGGGGGVLLTGVGAAASWRGRMTGGAGPEPTALLLNVVVGCNCCGCGGWRCC